LRRISLDELPQLINVLAGDMSIVGPRPEMPFIVEKYQEWEKKRLSVKPGLTGLWQVIGRQELPLEENVQYDYYYIKNRSLIMDISIVLRTIPALLSRRGAY
jgi:lipopolysaccharide/colanic/teichoic acid biosynthesis glycosyltransferase